MGCAQSKIENEETVTRCKERKRLMKEAVTARNAFAAAHSAYAMALKNTGAALSDYSHGEFLFSSSSSTTATAIASTSSLPTDISPPPPPSAAAVSNSVASSSSSAAIPQPMPDTLPPPPPPPLLPLQRAATMPEMNDRSGGGPSANGLNGIEEDGTLDNEDDDEDGELENRDRLIRKSRSRGGSNRGRTMIEDHHHQEEEPPSLPPANLRSIPPPRQTQHQHQQQQPFYDYFFPNVENMPGTTLEDTPPQLPQPHVTKPLPPQPRSPDTEEEEEEEEEEEDDDDDDDDDDGDDEEEEEEEEEEAETVVEQKAPVEEKSKLEEMSVELEKASNLRGMKKSKGLGMAGERRGVRMPVTTNLVNLFIELDDNFLKASESAHEVSKMLEATRLHYHSNFADNRGNDFNNFNKMIFF